MKKIHYALILLTISVGCTQNGDVNSSGGDLSAKNAALTDLKRQQSEITKQIAALEAEIITLDPSKAVPPKLISVAEIAPQGFESFIDLQGVISSENISYVAPRNGVGGYVKELLIKEGQYLKKGQLVLKLDDQVLKQSIAASKTQLGFAKDMYERTKNLWDQKIGTEVQLLSAKNNVDALENQIAIQEEQLSSYLVYADQTGIAEIVNIKPGELFTGISALGPQIQIVNNNDLSIHVDIPENYSSEVKKGTEVVVTIPSINKSFKTSIDRIGQSVNLTSRGFTAFCKIPSNVGLKPNMAASVKILNHTNPKAIVIPVNIVQSDEAGKYVFLMGEEEGKKIAKRVSVTLGELYGDEIEILSGLKPGDKLVTRGYQDLYEGQVVNNI